MGISVRFYVCFLAFLVVIVVISSGKSGFEKVVPHPAAPTGKVYVHLKNDSSTFSIGLWMTMGRCFSVLYGVTVMYDVVVVI